MAKAIKVIGCGTATVICMLLLLLVLCLENNKQEFTEPPTYLDPKSRANESMLSMRHQLLQLHRQKRYLLFPEGTSFQLVFDLIIGIVDYENYAILGVTCAVAWELPSKPPSELIENVLTRITDGTIGTVRRNGSVGQTEEQSVDEVEESINRMSANRQSLHAQPTSPPSPLTYTTNDHSSYYYTNVERNSASSPYANANANGQQQRQAAISANWHARQSMAKWRQAENPSSLPPTPSPLRSQWSKDNWWERNKVRVRQNWLENQRTWSTYEHPTWRYNYTPRLRPRPLLQKPPKHHIYPVFGRRRRRRRRSLTLTEGQNMDPAFERLHLHEHLKSRELLFGKIERLYKMRQLNGTACVLRALCESSQRHRQVRTKRMAKTPQGFIMELLSAIFQLPHIDDVNEVNGTLEHFISPHYLEAHQQQGSCRNAYGDCNNTFWLD
ncbi:uncharacterized protein Dwil_GK22824 [Drosophila willistoni]|uniref:Uncharacterized protein n=1 Tax=Drosophila willistoni TaxID=7260 RepID=B4NF21_DROWI|nr:uncharacterized protein LOC6649460 [Drosophila willistoni]EDW83396.1 uncharacterized protein Dwil_GK22824 [Drosophila willistoni]